MAEHAFDLNYVPQPIAFPTAQPQPVKKVPQKPELKRVPRPHVDRRAVEKANNKKALRIFLFAACAIVLLGLCISSYAARTESRHQLDEINEQLQLQLDASVVYANQLEKLVSAQNIDRIAMRRLGLVKISGMDEDYMDIATENKVIVSQSKDVETDG